MAPRTPTASKWRRLSLSPKEAAMSPTSPPTSPLPMTPPNHPQDRAVIERAAEARAPPRKVPSRRVQAPGQLGPVIRANQDASAEAGTPVRMTKRPRFVVVRNGRTIFKRRAPWSPDAPCRRSLFGGVLPPPPPPSGSANGA